jgi:hypothetical protein
MHSNFIEAVLSMSTLIRCYLVRVSIATFALPLLAANILIPLIALHSHFNVPISFAGALPTAISYTSDRLSRLMTHTEIYDAPGEKMDGEDIKNTRRMMDSLTVPDPLNSLYPRSSRVSGTGSLGQCSIIYVLGCLGCFGYIPTANAQADGSPMAGAQAGDPDQGNASSTIVQGILGTLQQIWSTCGLWGLGLVVTILVIFLATVIASPEYFEQDQTLPPYIGDPTGLFARILRTLYESRTSDASVNASAQSRKEHTRNSYAVLSYLTALAAPCAIKFDNIPFPVVVYIYFITIWFETQLVVAQFRVQKSFSPTHLWSFLALATGVTIAGTLICLVLVKNMRHEQAVAVVVPAAIVLSVIIYSLMAWAMEKRKIN